MLVYTNYFTHPKPTAPTTVNPYHTSGTSPHRIGIGKILSGILVVLVLGAVGSYYFQPDFMQKIPFLAQEKEKTANRQSAPASDHQKKSETVKRTPESQSAQGNEIEKDGYGVKVDSMKEITALPEGSLRFTAQLKAPIGKGAGKYYSVWFEVNKSTGEIYAYLAPRLIGQHNNAQFRGRLDADEPFSVVIRELMKANGYL